MDKALQLIRNVSYQEIAAIAFMALASQISIVSVIFATSSLHPNEPTAT